MSLRSAYFFGERRTSFISVGFRNHPGLQKILSRFKRCSSVLALVSGVVFLVRTKLLNEQCPSFWPCASLMWFTCVVNRVWIDMLIDNFPFRNPRERKLMGKLCDARLTAFGYDYSFFVVLGKKIFVFALLLPLWNWKSISFYTNALKLSFWNTYPL